MQIKASAAPVFDQPAICNGEFGVQGWGHLDESFIAELQ
jgi:hypothetical protein